MGHKYQPVPRKGDIYKKAWGHELWIANHEAYCGKLRVFEKDKKFVKFRKTNSVKLLQNIIEARKQSYR